MNESTFKTSLAVSLQVTVDYDLTGATGVVYLVSKPDGTTVTWTATVENAVLGITNYITQAGDLDQVGIYVLQAKVLYSGEEYFGDSTTFNVKEIIT